MKNRLFFASAIVLSMGLAACSPAEKNKDVEVTEPPVESVDDQTTTDMDKDKEVEKDLEDDKDKVDKDGDEEGLMTSDEDMIKAADYITHVKIVDVGDGTLKAELVENLKGDLEGKEIPNDENFKKDTEYIVFLKDEAGKAVPVNDKNHYRVYNGPDDEIIDKIEKNK